MSSPSQTEPAEEAFERGFRDACSDVIAAARRLKQRMIAGDLAAAEEFGQVAGTRMAEAGATHEESVHYMRRILAMVAWEHQA